RWVLSPDRLAVDLNPIHSTVAFGAVAGAAGEIGEADFVHTTEVDFFFPICIAHHVGGFGIHLAPARDVAGIELGFAPVSGAWLAIVSDIDGAVGELHQRPEDVEAPRALAPSELRR